MIRKLWNKIQSFNLGSKGKRKEIAATIDKENYSTKEVMGLIYKNKLWGGSAHDFYSGAGSHALKVVDPYVERMVEWLNTFPEKLIVCDLGCGDFNVGSQLVQHTKKYIGIDIVDELIQRNKQLFQKENLEFHCINIINEDVPDADCVLIRQVLQHLTNDEVSQVLEKLKKYKYIIVTEHVPFGDYLPNRDKKIGPGTRLSDKSGIDISEPPFNFKAVATKELLKLDFGRKKTQIVTTLYQTVS